MRRGFLLEGGAESVAECPLHRDSGGGVGAEGRGGSQATCPKWHGLIIPSHWGSFVPVGPDNLEEFALLVLSDCLSLS